MLNTVHFDPRQRSLFVPSVSSANTKEKGPLLAGNVVNGKGENSNIPVHKDLTTNILLFTLLQPNPWDNFTKLKRNGLNQVSTSEKSCNTELLSY